MSACWRHLKVFCASSSHGRLKNCGLIALISSLSLFLILDSNQTSHQILSWWTFYGHIGSCIAGGTAMAWYGHGRTTFQTCLKKFLAVVLEHNLFQFRETFLLSKQHAPPAPISLVSQTLTHMAFVLIVLYETKDKGG